VNDLRKLIPASILPSRETLAKLSALIDARQQGNTTRFETVTRKADEDSWNNAIKLVNSAFST